MSLRSRVLVITIGVLLIAFAALTALYAGEVFNIASIGGLLGVGLLVWATRAGRDSSH